MKSITKNCEDIYEIKKSKFLTHIYHVNNLDEINNILNNLKIKYKDATHICYAYKINNLIKCNDDNEPSNTAGLPILDVLNKWEIDYVLAVVIRYFGGIKLGSNGLIRAYSKAVANCLSNTEIKELITGVKVKIYLEYNDLKKINYILKNCEIENKNYDDQIYYIVNISNDNINIISEYKYDILENILLMK